MASAVKLTGTFFGYSRGPQTFCWRQQKSTARIARPPVVPSAERRPWYWRSQRLHTRPFTSQTAGGRQEEQASSTAAADKSTSKASTSAPQSEKAPTKAAPSTEATNESLPPGWEDEPDYNITSFSQLPYRTFGSNQHLRVNEEFKRTLQQMLWQFKAPIRYSFAYGSGVFPQSDKAASDTSLSPHPHPPEAIVKWQKGGGKIIDFIFGVTFTQHWHSLNLNEHRDHYSFLGSFGSGLITRVQDNWGAGVYFNPYITVNGTMIKYGVVNLDTIARDLSEWDTLYLAGRLQKPVKILRDDARVRLANQINLISAVRTALLMLGPSFTEKELYTAIAGISYMGDPRMSLGSENPKKVDNIVTHQLLNFRQLYAPLIADLPNVSWTDPRCKGANWAAAQTDTDAAQSLRMAQDMDPVRRGNMVRRLPKAFRAKLYRLYQAKFQMPGREFARMLEESQDEDAAGSFKRRQGGPFDRRIAAEPDLREMVARAIRQTVKWPSTGQSLKGVLTAGPQRAWRYLREKREKNREGKAKGA